MRRFQAIKEFSVEEFSTENMWYKIVVKIGGKVVEEFLRPTLTEARRDFQLAGYKRVGGCDERA